jgi:hypothetical protein
VDPATIAIAGFVLSAGVILVAAVTAVAGGRARGIAQVEDRADGEIKRLVDAQGERLLLLEKANAEKDLTIAAQNKTIAGLTAKQADLQAKVADLEHQLAVERRVTANMRAASEADGK